MELMNQVNGQVIANEVKEAYTFLSRLKGLMFTSNLPSGSGLHLQPCQSIHTFFMNYSIDVLYLDEKLKIVALEENVKPGKLGKVVKSSKSVIELPAGTIAETNTRINQVVQLKK